MSSKDTPVFRSSVGGFNKKDVTDYISRLNRDYCEAVEEKDADAAKAAYDKANSVLDKAVSSGIKTGNYAARQKSRLAKAVNTIGK